MSEAPSSPPPSSQAGRTAGDNAAEKEEEETDSKVDILWVEVSPGYSFANIAQFENENFLPTVAELEDFGPALSLAMGFRWYVLAVGVRSTLASYSAFSLGNILLDVALRLPAPFIEPFVRAGLGYGWMGDSNVGYPREQDLSVYGLVVEAGVGVDIYPTSWFSIGAGIDLAFLNLTRQQDEGCPSSACRLDEVNFEESGDAAGLQARVLLRAILHL